MQMSEQRETKRQKVFRQKGDWQVDRETSWNENEWWNYIGRKITKKESILR